MTGQVTQDKKHYPNPYLKAVAKSREETYRAEHNQNLSLYQEEKCTCEIFNSKILVMKNPNKPICRRTIFSKSILWPLVNNLPSTSKENKNKEIISNHVVQIYIYIYI